MIDYYGDLQSLTKAQLITFAENTGLKVKASMKKSELVDLIIQSNNYDVVRLPGELDTSYRRARLHGRILDSSMEDSSNAWIVALEQIIQMSIRELSEQFVNNYYVKGMRETESVIFAKCLTSVVKEWQEEGRRVPHQLSLFCNPVGLISFQIHDREYRCVKYPPKGIESSFTVEDLEKYYSAINHLSKRYSSSTTILDDLPTLPELLAHVIDHLQEEFRSSDMKLTEEDLSTMGEEAVFIHPVHPARRSAIRDWQKRLEDHLTEIYSHRESEESYYAYPVLDLVVPDSTYMIVVMVTPLDLIFVDEKVNLDHRCAEICLAIYDVEKVYYPGADSELSPQLKQALGRVLFTSMHQETSQALTASYTAQSAILRHWVSEAAKGYEFLIGINSNNRSFDGLKFCEAIIHKILCAKIPGVETEIYPFDRAFIFREAGASSRLGKDIPIEVTILETSVLSNNPADRGLFLTRRERSIRETEDYECDTAEKIVKDDNIYRFYIHGSENALILSRDPHLSPEDKLEIARGVPSSYSQGNPETRPFLIPLPEEEAEEGLPLVLYNLVGRLIPSNYDTKYYEDPMGEKQYIHSVEAFETEFERKRLQVTEKYDESGLLYIYEHGLNLAKDIPLLDAIQSAYFHYLDLKYKARDEQYRREALRQDNLSDEQITEILDAYKIKRGIDRTEGTKNKNRNAGSIVLKGQSAKVVYISFSWMLNDQNMQRMLSIGENGKDEEIQNAILGDEYIYTLILVSDNDPEKSLSQLNAERENLKLFFGLIMKRIWFDKVAEYDYLEKKSRSISDSLGQFLHRSKALIPDPKGRQEIQVLYENIYRQIQPIQKAVKEKIISDQKEVFSLLLGVPILEISNIDAIRHYLSEINKLWFSGNFPNYKSLQIEIMPESIPELRIRLPETVIQEAFNVIYKNACEAALARHVDNKSKFVKIQIQLVPNIRKNQKDLWYVDIILENSGGPIPLLKISKLNDPNPKPLDQNEEKEGSTGIGVFLARYQLQNNIGDGADIFFVNLGDGVVQTRLRLPVSLEKKVTEVVPDIGIKDISLDSDYILYVEDNPNEYKDAINELQAILEPYGVALNHRRGAVEALKLIDIRMPRAIFTDLHIIHDEISREQAALRHGLTFINQLLEKSHKIKQFPPIWVMTAEDESVVREHLGNVASRGYRFVPNNLSDQEILSESRTIRVFSHQKRPDKVLHFHNFVKELFEPNELTIEQKEEPADVGSGIDTKQVNWIALSLHAHDFINLDDIHRLSLEGQSSKLIVIQDHCEDLEEIGKDLGIWFKHPGLSIFDQLVKAETKYRLSNHVWHKNIILYLIINQSLYERFPIQILYWGLSRNLFFKPNLIREQDVVRIWTSIRHEDRGPFSQLRHDLKNEWSSPDLAQSLKSTIETINACEHTVSITNELRLRLDSFAFNEKEAMIYLNKSLKKGRVVTKDRKSIRQQLQALDNKLLIALDIEHTLLKSVEIHRSMLHSLDDYLGGS